ncbi:MAG: carbohydrate binding family 9 domain-containing protein [Chitinophagaceae bacterium]|nr:carbohydrate binding family 9 domain-containing protein [Chitinophagaceae bacterium]
MKTAFVILLNFLVVLGGWTMPGSPLLEIRSQKVNEAPVIDGRLNDAVWSEAEMATNFIVNQPKFGAPSMCKTEVRVVYTDQAIFVGAHLNDDPALIRRQITPRDGERMQDTDVFGVVFDTYRDKQNAFQFNVTAANVQSDMRISPSRSDPDYSWDAVWDSRVSMVADGWIVEMRIPYMSLRFSAAAEQDWGVNFYRFIRRENENSYWNPVNPEINGFVNQFGSLKGLANLKPPLRLSFLPYLSAGFQTVPTNDGRTTEILKSGGLDVKYGINESFTLDATLIPDFGQVVSDNVVLNLSPFEIQFQENRPFFTEGTELFNKAGIFYSRRVGAQPSGYYDAREYADEQGYTMVRNPGITRLYNATKFSGRNRHNLGIGIFNAVGAPMHAEMKTPDGEIIHYDTEPLTNYNIVVLDQALTNRSFISLTNTNVLRNGSARDANVTAFAISLFDKKNRYNFYSATNYSKIFDSTGGYDGFKTVNRFSKVSGNWQWGITNNIESERYDPNDLGLLLAPNEVSTEAFVNWQQFVPNERYNFRSYRVSVVQTNLFKPLAYTNLEYRANFLHVFKNFWDVSLNISGQALWSDDYFEMRTPGVMVHRTPFLYAGIRGSTDSRKKLFISYGGGFAEGPIDDDPYFNTRAGARYRFNNKLSLELNWNREHDTGNFGYAYRETNGDPILGRRELLNNQAILNGIYNFTPRMNLTFRARHYWSRVTYVAFFDVQPDGWWTDRPFVAGKDQNYNAFNLDAFFTWDFRLGSRLIVAWKNALGPDEYINGKAYTKYGENLIQTLASPHSNEVTFRFIYFLDYNQFSGKKNKA